MKSFNRIVLAFLCIIVVLACEEDPDPPPEPLQEFSILSPEEGAKQVSITTSFSWQESVGADRYTLLVSKRNDFTTTALVVTDLAETSWTTKTPLDAGTLYYWKVIALNNGGEIEATNGGLSFRTKPIPPRASPSISKYFVSPIGEDNPDRGSEENPFKTVAYAATRIPPGEGDTLYIKPGTYLETDPIVVPLGLNVIGSGESNTILSSGGVTLAAGINSSAQNFKLWYDGSLVQLVSKHRTTFRNNSTPAVAPENGNQTISGFTIDGQNKSLKVGVWVENRSNVTMHHITFKNLAQRGAVFGPGDKDFYVYPEHYMTGVLIHDCTFLNSGKDLSSETLGNLCIAQLDGAEIYNINIEDNQGYGIKFIYDGYFKNVKIHDCQITLNESDSKWGEDIAVELWNLGPGNEISNITCNTWVSIVNHPDIFGTPNGAENMKVRSIRMIDKDGSSSKEAVEIGAPGVEVSDSYFENKGIGIAIWDMGRENITVRNNIFYNAALKNNWASGAAVYIDNSRTWSYKNIQIFNNVFDTHAVAVKIKGDNISDIKIKNNAFLNASVDVEASGNDIECFNNLKYSVGSYTWLMTGVTAADNNITGAPLFFNTGNRWETFYRPSSETSFVVNKGVDVGLSFKGSAPDIGAFEF